MARELAWKLGNWKTPELDAFLDNYKPDVILYSSTTKIHLCDMVEYVIKKSGAKAVGYIWDDTFTYKQSDEIGYKIYRFFQRKALKKVAKLTDRFFAISDIPFYVSTSLPCSLYVKITKYIMKIGRFYKNKRLSEKRAQKSLCATES